MKNLLRKIIHYLKNLLPFKLLIYLSFWIHEKKYLSLKNPHSLSEKIQWMKVYGKLERYTSLADKYEVRKYVSKSIGEDKLIPLIGVWDSTDDIPFAKLPNKFVIKATHGCAYNIICRDKSEFDQEGAVKLLNKWLKENYYKGGLEAQYKNSKPRIIIEKYLDDNGKDPKDYKIFCFHGEPVIIALDSDRYEHHRRDIFNTNWEQIPMISYYPISSPSISRPKNLDELLNLASKLSKDFTFVRVDFYSIKNKIYFGEFTFTPASGILKIKPYKYDKWLGEKLNLTKLRLEIQGKNPWL